MADPVITTTQTQGADIEAKSLQDNHAVTLTARRRKNTPVAILPGGRRVDASKYMHVRYESQGATGVLGNPEEMLTADWKREHPEWHYAWPVRQSNETAAYLRAGWYVAVPYDAIDTVNPMAAIADVKTPSGTYIVWKQHILVAIPPEAWGYLVDNYEAMAIQRTVNRGDELEDLLDQQFSRGGYKAEVDLQTDARQER